MGIFSHASMQHAYYFYFPNKCHIKYASNIRKIFFSPDGNSTILKFSEI